jgi:hypothetical protein
LPKEIIIIFQNHVKTEKQVFFIKKKKIECQTKNSKKKKEKKKQRK